jgi:hypothetical protein
MRGLTVFPFTALESVMPALSLRKIEAVSTISASPEIAVPWSVSGTKADMDTNLSSSAIAPRQCWWLILLSKGSCWFTLSWNSGIVAEGWRLIIWLALSPDATFSTSSEVISVSDAATVIVKIAGGANLLGVVPLSL